MKLVRPQTLLCINPGKPVPRRTIRSEVGEGGSSQKVGMQPCQGQALGSSLGQETEIPQAAQGKAKKKKVRGRLEDSEKKAKAVF